MKEAKEYDWKRLIEDLLKVLFLTQKTLAKKCKVTQQSISLWTKGERKPGIKAKKVLLELAENKIDLKKYEIYPIKGKFLEMFEKLSNTEKIATMEFMEGYIINKRIKPMG